jgi:uncharacterized protein
MIRSGLLGLFVPLLLVGGCAAGRDIVKPIDSSVGPNQVYADTARVDCLLPGQVRRLGTHITYATPRRKITTTARDCDIRGGESPDLERAGYGTAVGVW